MLDITKDIDSLTNFKRNTTQYLQRIKESGNPLILTVNGKAEVVVQDAESYQKLLELVDRIQAIEGIQAG
ncbi:MULTISPECIES: type II toxin-antitoxin system Phd/YefM family antitoxin [Okeania]|nr:MULTISPECIES: type II toxin-antitoxin system Phd/YefM family antitoxin [Okeania]